MTLALLVSAAGFITVGAAGASRARWFARAVTLQAAGAALLSVAGSWALASGATVGSGFTSAFQPRFGVDGLTAFFLMTVGAVAAPTLLYARSYTQVAVGGRVVAALCGVFVLVK